MANTIQIKRKTTTGAPSVGSLADGELCLVVPDSALYQRVDGSTLIQINGGGSTDLKPYCVTGSGTNITGTIGKMDLTVEQVTNANYSLSSSEITVTDAGDYEISWNIVVDEDSTSGGTRGRLEGEIQVNSTQVLQSRAAVYVREASGGSGLGNSFVVTLAASDVIKLMCFNNGTADPDNSSEMAQISIIKLG